MANLEIDYKKAAQQLRSGEALFGKDGALAPMLERILNAALEGEMDAHLNSVDCSSGNRRNGKMSKTVQTKYGETSLYWSPSRITFFRRVPCSPAVCRRARTSLLHVPIGSCVPRPCF